METLGVVNLNLIAGSAETKKNDSIELLEQVLFLRGSKVFDRRHAKNNEHNERFNIRPFYYYRRFVDEIIFTNWVQQIKVEYLSSLPIIGHYNKAFLRKKKQRGHDGC